MHETLLNETIRIFFSMKSVILFHSEYSAQYKTVSGKKTSAGYQIVHDLQSFRAIRVSKETSKKTSRVHSHFLAILGFLVVTGTTVFPKMGHQVASTVTLLNPIYSGKAQKQKRFMTSEMIKLALVPKKKKVLERAYQTKIKTDIDPLSS